MKLYYKQRHKQSFKEPVDVVEKDGITMDQAVTVLLEVLVFMFLCVCVK